MFSSGAADTKDFTHIVAIVAFIIGIVVTSRNASTFEESCSTSTTALGASHFEVMAVAAIIAYIVDIDGDPFVISYTVVAIVVSNRAFGSSNTEGHITESKGDTKWVFDFRTHLPPLINYIIT